MMKLGEKRKRRENPKIHSELINYHIAYKQRISDTGKYETEKNFRCLKNVKKVKMKKKKKKNREVKIKIFMS